MLDILSENDKNGNSQSLSSSPESDSSGINDWKSSKRLLENGSPQIDPNPKRIIVSSPASKMRNNNTLVSEASASAYHSEGETPERRLKHDGMFL